MKEKVEAEEVFLTSQEVARILRIDKRTLQNYRSEAKIPFFQINKRTIRYWNVDVHKFLQNSNCSSYVKDANCHHFKQH